ncbi:hypothetical protein COL922a_010325 [Colletotrichum nupharicola]|nr:hypothetical protein COL922a_010325 [Colletotrichum nupharicola]
MSPSAVDLAYLELPRTHDTTRSTPDVEDDLAVRMLGLGATWWPNWVTYSRHKARIDDDVIYDFHFPPKTYVGYPSTGGVWVMQFSPDQNWFDSLGQYGKQRMWPEMPLDFHVRMGMVLSMDEKCEAIRDFGGVFWEKVAECGLVAKDLDEGREKWRGFEGHLRSFLVAYPSRGGLVLMHPSPLDLQHLDLPRTHDTPRSSLPAVEDGLADRMLRLGAHWWPSWTLYAQHADRLSSGTVYDFHFPPDVYVGYPSSGGVWVVRFSPDRGNLGKHARTSLPQRPEAWNRVMRHVLTMDERCEALKGFGARFYEDIDMCEDICKTVREGVEEFVRFEALLGRIEDREYQERWFTAFHVGGRAVEVRDAVEDKRNRGWGCVLL